MVARVAMIMNVFDVPGRAQRLDQVQPLPAARLTGAPPSAQVRPPGAGGAGVSGRPWGSSRRSAPRRSTA